MYLLIPETTGKPETILNGRKQILTNSKKKMSGTQKFQKKNGNTLSPYLYKFSVEGRKTILQERYGKDF